MSQLADRYRNAVAKVGNDGPWSRTQPAPGTGCDLLAMDGMGRLLVIEVKPATSTEGITWAPVQVGLYADLFRRWASQDAYAAAGTVRRMLQQRMQLGLSPDLGVRLREPLEIVPVVAIGGEIRSKVALARLGEVQRALTDNHVGWANLEVWSIGGAGQKTLIPIPSV